MKQLPVETAAPRFTEQFKTTIEESNLAYSFYDRVVGRLNEMGVPPRQRPLIGREHESLFAGVAAGQAFDGRLPTVIRKLDLDQLSDIHALFSSWFAFVSYQERLADARKSEARHKKEIIWAQLRDIHKIDENREKRSDQQASDAARADKRFVEADSYYAEMDALHSCLESAVRIASEDLKTISREVTRKQLMLERDNQKRFGGQTPAQFRQSRVETDNEEEPAVRNSEGSPRKYSRGSSR